MKEKKLLRRKTNEAKNKLSRTWTQSESGAGLVEDFNLARAVDGPQALKSHGLAWKWSDLALKYHKEPVDCKGD
jgi:hypothetical protein